MQRCVIYTRVSSTNQAEEGYSLETQLAACRTYAHQHDMLIDAELWDDISGATLDRPALSEARLLIAEHQVSALIVYTGDRLSRDVAHAALLRQEFRNAGCDLHYVMRGQVHDDPHTQLVEHIMTAMAEMERSLIRERMMRGRRGKVAAGLVPGQGKPPYGYTYVQDGPHEGRLEIIERQAQVVRRIYEQYLNGVGVTEISFALEADGILPPGYGRYARRRADALWSRPTLYDVLRNPVYMGEFMAYRLEQIYVNGKAKTRRRPPSEWVSIPVPSIIEPPAWHAVQARLANGRTLSKRNSKTFYLLARRVHCGHCGRRLVAQTDSREVRTYRCPNHGRLEPDRCSAPRFRCDPVDTVVWSWVEGLLTDPTYLRAGIEEQERRRCEESSRTTDQRATLERELHELGQRQSRLLDLYEQGHTDSAVVGQRLAALDTQQRTIVEQIAGIDRPLVRPSIDYEAMIASVAQAITDDPSEEERRYVLDTLDVNVTLALVGQERHATISVGGLGLDHHAIIV